MRTIFAAAMVFAATAAAMAADPCSVDSQWKIQPLPQAGGRTINSAFFIDSNTGWLVGDEGLCLRTVDCGATWQSAATGSSAKLRCVRFNDANRGWACGDGDANAPRIREGHYMIGGNMKCGTLLASDDGGMTWLTLWVQTAFKVTAVEISADPTFQVGISGGERHPDGDITRTKDAGKNWNSERCFRALYDVRSVDANNWIAAGSAVRVSFTPVPDSPLYTQHDCRILYSGDRGKTWQPAAGTDGNDILRALAVRKSAALAVGDGGDILRSTDNGATWQKVESGSSEDLTGVCWGPGESPAAIAVGRKGTILISGDGGITWKISPSPTNLNLQAVAPVGDGFMAAGEKGLLLRWAGHSAGGKD